MTMKSLLIVDGSKPAAWLPDLQRALFANGPAIFPLDPASFPLTNDLTSSFPTLVPNEVALVVRTSGSTTGIGKMVGLSAAALLASANASAKYLGGHLPWIQVLPCWHIAGLQTLVRSLIANQKPILLGTGHFSASSFATEIEQRPDLSAYLSIVPTQLRACIDSSKAITQLKRLSAILVGGQSVNFDLLEIAKAAGLNLITTYGMTETSGGCVYDGNALPGVIVKIDKAGRISLGGPQLASGYIEIDASPTTVPKAAHFTDDPAFSRNPAFFHSADQGRFTSEKTLEVLGRLDDAFTTGGETISPQAIEQALQKHISNWLKNFTEQQNLDFLVVPTPHPHWGQSATILIACPHSQLRYQLSQHLSILLAKAKESVTHELSAVYQPKRVILISEVKFSSSGKINRKANSHLATDLWIKGSSSINNSAKNSLNENNFSSRSTISNPIFYWNLDAEQAEGKIYGYGE